MGARLSTPARPARGPCWKIATATPVDAPMVSRKPSTAFKGTSSERKTSTSSRKARTTISAGKTGRASGTLAVQEDSPVGTGARRRGRSGVRRTIGCEPLGGEGRPRVWRRMVA